MMVMRGRGTGEVWAQELPTWPYPPPSAPWEVQAQGLTAPTRSPCHLLAPPLRSPSTSNCLLPLLAL